MKKLIEFSHQSDPSDLLYDLPKEGIKASIKVDPLAAIMKSLAAFENTAVFVAEPDYPKAVRILETKHFKQERLAA